jgi:PAS domain S-box-containing protein
LAYCKIVLDDNNQPVDYVFLEVNAAFEKQTGLKKENIVGKKATELIPNIKNSPFDFIGIHGKVTLTGEPVVTYQEDLKRWHSVYVVSPKKTFFLSMFTDITKHKQAEEELTYQANLLSKANDAVFGVDADLVITYWNRAAENIFGWTKAEVLGKNSGELLKTIIEGSSLTEFLARLHAMGNYGGEVQYLRKDGTYFPADVNAADIKDDNGKLLGTVTVVRDISERKKAEEALRKQASLINLSPDAIIVKKLDDTITFWSQGAKTLYGWTKEEAIGQKSRLLLKTKFPEPYEEILTHLKRYGRWSGEKIHQTKTERKITVESRWLAKFNETGRIEEILETNVDITKRKKAEEKLEEYTLNLEKLVEERTKQLKDAERLATIGTTAGMVGHDIRNPLQAITGDIYLTKKEIASMSESEEKKNVLKRLEEIQENIYYIDKIVADLQDYARPIIPMIREIYLQKLINELLAKNGIPENVQVQVQVQKEVGTVVADSDILKRILGNLIINAVQAMPRGGKLSIQACKEANDSIITVEDTGLGIADEVKDKLFAPLFTTKAKGQGFGLAVVRRMTEALGGTVSFESQEGKGTTFIVRLPPKK